MPQFTYVGDPGRYYPDFGLEAGEPGSEHELDEAPTDGRWHDAAGQVVEAAAPPVDEHEPEPHDDDGNSADDDNSQE